MNRAILRSEVTTYGAHCRGVCAAFFSLAKTQRRLAGEYRMWAREAEASGNLANYRRFAKMARETFRAGRQNLSWARHYRDLANWRQ